MRANANAAFSFVRGMRSIQFRTKELSHDGQSGNSGPRGAARHSVNCDSSWTTKFSRAYIDSGIPRSSTYAADRPSSPAGAAYETLSLDSQCCDPDHVQRIVRGLCPWRGDSHPAPPEVHYDLLPSRLSMHARGHRRV